MAYQHEKTSRKRARSVITRAGYRVGGHLKQRGIDAKIEKAVHEHEAHDHKGEPKTKLKLASGGAVSGYASGGRLDKGKRGGKGAQVTVNVIHTGGDKKQPVPVPVPVGGGRPGMPPQRPPMGAPPGAGGPPPGGPPMMGGGMKKGGRVHMTAGAGSGEGRLEKARALKGGRKGGKGRA